METTVFGSRELRASSINRESRSLSVGACVLMMIDKGSS